MRNAMIEADQTVKASDSVSAPLPEVTMAFPSTGNGG
jgi:hypothetical protein